MNILCWLLGHDEHEFVEDFISITQTNNMVNKNVKIGEIDTSVKLAVCKRCNVVYAKSIEKQTYFGRFSEAEE